MVFMDLAFFILDAERLLVDVLDRTGSILYSAVDTLSPGDIYILGLNPGGNGGPTIAEHLESLPEKRNNAYIDECWDNKAADYGLGKAPLQRRLKCLMDCLGYDLRSICASNLVFMKTHDARGLDFPRDADTCWPIHERILAIVHPKLILAFGNSRVSPYHYLFERFGDKEEAIPSGHGKWRCRGFDTKMNGRKVYVVGLPHLSRYSPKGKVAVIQWLKDKLNN